MFVFFQGTNLSEMQELVDYVIFTITIQAQILFVCFSTTKLY